MNCLNHMCDDVDTSDGEEEIFSVSYEDTNLDTKFRGVADVPSTMTAHFHDFRAIESNEISFKVAGEVDAWVKMNATPKMADGTCSGTVSSSPTVTAGPLIGGLSMPPFVLPSSKFTVKRAFLGALVEDIKLFLTSVADFDFSYLSVDHMWRGKYLQGSYCIELDIALYYDKERDEFTVAVFKTKGHSISCSAFHDFFSSFSAHFGGEPPSKRRRVLLRDAPPSFDFDVSSMPPQAAAPCSPETSTLSSTSSVLPAHFQLQSQPPTLTEQSFLESVQHIFDMAGPDSFLESRLEATKMICDLAGKDMPYLELPAFQQPCLEILERLVHDDDDDIRQFAIIAVTTFVEGVAAFHSRIIRSRIMPEIFSLICNPTSAPSAFHETAQIRRSAAYALSLLCRSQPYQVRAHLQQQHLCDVDGWIEFTVPTITDARTKQHAEAAAEILSELSTGQSAILSADLAASPTGSHTLDIDDYNYFSVLHSLG